MSPPQLPTEIWERVIDWIPIFDGLGYRWMHNTTTKNTLSACSLVNWSWLPRARFHLFIHVELTTTRQSQAFLSILLRFPSASKGVKQLAIFPSKPDSTTAKIEPSHYNWVYNILATLPNFLTELESLIFTELPDLHPTFIVMASRFRSVRELQLLELDKMSFSEVVRLINRFPRLQVLNIANCQWVKPAHYYPSKKCQLYRLWFDTDGDCQDDALRWMTSSMDCFSALQVLLLTSPSTMTVRGDPRVESILVQCSRTLKFLLLDIDEENFGEYNDYIGQLIGSTPGRISFPDTPYSTGMDLLEPVAHGLYGIPTIAS
ncbi:hypothetical protein NLI96_g9604 [Meripilus lineatus]|uniref:F-box domain-containing protein n=1 Tax=Meripilus lineatus TaxID=2056292 RepID=A0AAD5UV60_9APHY|nr:hypothetical protein NLI96_g9604 [Physisporinus lineatus]